jgi:predicted metal-dependent hydrolase
MTERPGPTGCGALPPPLLLQGVDEFNRGEFFACHETLETLWKQERAPVRELYQGIIQIAVACYHRERGNYRGAVILLERGLAHLRALPGECQGVRVDALARSSERALLALRELGPAHLSELDRDWLPKVEVRAQAGVDAAAG